MNFITVKKDSEIVLPDCEIEVERQNDSIKSLLIYNGDECLKIAGVYGSVEVLKPAPPKIVKKYRLAGAFAGLASVDEWFDTQEDADARLNEFKAKFRGSDEDLGLSITEVECPERE